LSDQRLDELLAQAGSDEPRVRKILTEVLLNLLEARLVVNGDLWHRVSQNDAFAMQFLTGVLGSPGKSWDDTALLGQPALSTLRSVNRRAHAFTTTQGGASFRAAVIRDQGGEFCSMCGRLDMLAVDHITPVSLGGSQDDVRNMQMLCNPCNLGKSAMKDRLLPVAVALRPGSDIPPSLRFKHLLLDSVEVQGRTRGVCRCGQQASTTVVLQVTVGPANAAANILTLTTRCNMCTLPKGPHGTDRN
jgi:hypothetical protein